MMDLSVSIGYARPACGAAQGRAEGRQPNPNEFNHLEILRVRPRTKLRLSRFAPG